MFSAGIETFESPLIKSKQTGEERAGTMSPLQTGGRFLENAILNWLRSDCIIKLFVCVFYGMIPKFFAEHNRKAYAMFISVTVVLFQWYVVAGYIYCYKKDWGPKGDSPIPIETLLLLLGLAISGAITVTLAMHYFYTNKNNFSDGKGSFYLVPKIELCDRAGDERDAESDGISDLSMGHQIVLGRPVVVMGRQIVLGHSEWLMTNGLFAFGVAIVCLTIATDFKTQWFFDFKGIRDFLDSKKTTPANRVIYYIAVFMLYWGCIGTVCACAIFHIMSRQIITLINNTEKLLLDSAMTRQQFFECHERLITFTEKMIKKFGVWFAVHGVMFIFLLAAMIYELMKFFNQKRPGDWYWSQISGSSLICYKFAFPLLSASRVTVRFEEFYVKLARSNKFQDIPELLLFPTHIGFQIFGVRITPNVAIVVFISTFVGFLKFVSYN